MTSPNDRPLWRTGTKTLVEELRRRVESGQLRAVVPTLVYILAARGYVVLPPAEGVPFEDMHGAQDGVHEANAPLLGKRWPMLADEELPFDAENEHGT
jgi:hypothetical protein